jgi:KDEL-tailed cysteine endopeptidase
MKSQVAVKLAVVGVAACAAVFALNAYGPAEGSALFETIATEEQEYMMYLAKYGRNFGTKAEYNLRFSLYKETK